MSKNKTTQNVSGKAKPFTVKQLAFSAAAVALATVLSLITLFSYPTGGSITPLSMLVICLPGFWFGPVVGICAATAYGLLQLLIDPYILFPAQLIMDYFLAFGVMGLSGLFTNAKHGLIKGYFTAVLGRYFFASLSGFLFFAEYAWEGWNPILYSFAYNATYIFTEAAITVVVLLLPPVHKAMLRIKQEAVGKNF